MSYPILFPSAYDHQNTPLSCFEDTGKCCISSMRKAEWRAERLAAWIWSGECWAKRVLSGFRLSLFHQNGSNIYIQYSVLMWHAPDFFGSILQQHHKNGMFFVVRPCFPLMFSQAWKVSYTWLSRSSVFACQRCRWRWKDWDPNHQRFQWSTQWFQLNTLGSWKLRDSKRLENLKWWNCEISGPTGCFEWGCITSYHGRTASETTACGILWDPWLKSNRRGWELRIEVRHENEHGWFVCTSVGLYYAPQNWESLL